ncbi:hypothetical protein [Marivita sp.]|uniref:hypothetical protein n=1 Tax=Marivita sp. TaxID=2003365 RepID=UPI00261C5999|nr:hypothetical protein [Marivita sp.]
MNADSYLHANDVSRRLYDDDEVGLFPMAHGKQCSFAFGGMFDSVFGSPVTVLQNGLLAQTVIIAEGCAPETYMLVSDCEAEQAIRLSASQDRPTDLDVASSPKLIGELISPKGELDIIAETSIDKLAQNAMNMGIAVDAVEFSAPLEVQPGSVDTIDLACGCRYFFPGSSGSRGQ